MSTSECLTAYFAFIFIASTLVAPAVVSAQYVMESLGRGVVAVRSTPTTVYVGWRLLGTDPAEIAFNIYRSTDGGTPVEAEPETALDDDRFRRYDCVDMTRSNSYIVRPVRAGRELAPSAPATVRANAPIEQFLTVPLQRPRRRRRRRSCRGADQRLHLQPQRRERRRSRR